jgi:hypothetical protein
MKFKPPSLQGGGFTFGTHSISEVNEWVVVYLLAATSRIQVLQAKL